MNVLRYAYSLLGEIGKCNMGLPCLASFDGSRPVGELLSSLDEVGFANAEPKGECRCGFAFVDGAEASVII
jgi:hypothetical protein